jgi:N-acetylglutamate synthase-like GNAT family acetyltransferase
MKIRPATINNSEEISKCHRASIQKLCKDHYSPETIEKWTGILLPKIYGNAIKEKILIVAEEKNKISGFGILDIEHTELSALYIHPDSTGKGIAKKILSRLEAIALEKNVHQLNLCSTMNAIGFYKHHGYLDGSTTFHKLPNGIRLECIKMHKMLRKTV